MWKEAGDAARHVKLPLMMSVSLVRASVWIPNVPLGIHIPADVSGIRVPADATGEAAEDGPSAWEPAIHAAGWVLASA